MPIYDNHFQKQLALLFLAGAVLVVSVTANAAKKETSQIREASVYIIKDGDYLGSIAISHGVSIAELIEANGLENPDKIYSGMELMIPGAKMNSGEDRKPVRRKKKKIFAEIPKGFTLTRVAKAYGVSIEAIMRANKKLDNPDNLRAGKKILIPGATEEIELVPPPPCFNPAVEFYRIRNDKSIKVHLTYCNGKANPDGVEKLSQFTSPPNLKEMPFPLHPRLAVLLQKVADHFPGRRLEVVSGQRVQKKKNHESFHNKGQAIDFRVAGIPNRTLVNYVRQFDNTGVGFYPNSVFVHMDTRKRNAFWIDYSRPGEKAIYARAGLPDDELEEIRKSRSLKKAERKAARRAAAKAKRKHQPEQKKLAQKARTEKTVSLASVEETETTRVERSHEKDSAKTIQTPVPAAATKEAQDTHSEELAAIQSPGQV